MTDTTTLLALAERAEKAGADEQREIILEARRLMDPFGFRHDCARRAMSPCHRCNRFEALLDAEAYESAALMLVPDDARQCWATGYGTDGRAFATIAFDRSCYATTPALAIVAAALRAQAGEGE